MSQRHTQFQAEGYIKLADFFSPDEFAELVAEQARYVAQVVPHLPGPEVFYEDKDDQTTLKQLPRMNTHDKYFYALLHRPALVELAEELLQDDVVPKAVQWFNKPALVGEATPPHQDGYYFMLEPNEAITMWIPLAPVDEGNGCVRYLPGSHLRGMRPHGRSTTLGFSQHILDFGDADRQREIPMPLVPGDLMAHHSMLVHRAGANRSERQRPAMGIVYHAARAREDEAAKRAYLDRLNAEMTAQGKI